MSTPYTGTTRWLVTLTVVLVAFVEVLDMTIVNVSLPNMMGALGANSQQITWVLTSYIVSSAVCMPLTGFLIKRFGQKQLLLINIVGFLISSMLCGSSTTLQTMVVFRVLQGVFGASLVPLSQLILREAFPPEEQGKAMAIWGMGIMVAPVMGPTLGGYITELLNWRWVFFINLPVCIVAFVLSWQLIKPSVGHKSKIDWTGLTLMVVGIGCLQIFLDHGNQKDWFASPLINILLVTWVTALFLFIKRGLNRSDNILKLTLFKDYNFSLGCTLIASYCIIMMGIMAIQPIMMENFMGYSARMTGIIMAPRGLASAVMMGLCAGAMKRFDPRQIVMAGVLFSALGSWQMVYFSPDCSISYMMIANAIQGMGMGLFFVPLSVVTFSTLKPESIGEAAGIFSFGRGIGSSIGISILSTLLTRESQINWNHLSGHISVFNPNLQLWLNHQHWTLQNPLALQMLAKQLTIQSGMIAFIDAYWLVSISFIFMLPLIYCMRKPQKMQMVEAH